MSHDPAGPPVAVGELLRDLHAELVRLLRSLEPEEWDRPTSAGRWRVRDVVAHLLDLDIRRLGAGRDGHPPPPPERPFEGYEDLLAYLNALNEDWVRAARRISTPVLIDFLETAGAQAARHLASLDPFEPALYPVAWAGEEQSRNWFDVGREYVERWHHQDQLREAVGARPLTGARWLGLVVDLSLRALPHAYREVEASPGTWLALRLIGEAGGEWALRREEERWALTAPGAASFEATTTSERGAEVPPESEAGSARGPDCELEVEAARAARLLLRGRSTGSDPGGRGEAGGRKGTDAGAGATNEKLRAAGITVHGDPRLAEPFLEARALMV